VAVERKEDQGANVSPLVEKMRQLCQTEVDNGSIYVWAAGGNASGRGAGLMRLIRYPLIPAAAGDISPFGA
jgi:hypothetical protein